MMRCARGYRGRARVVGPEQSWERRLWVRLYALWFR